ncbi:MAG: metal ABC transporter permease [Dehalococcoidia bacterium]
MPMKRVRTMIDWLIDPLRDDGFRRAMLDVLAVSIVAGVVGTFIVLRGTAFLGDALAHAVFPGIVIAFLIGSSLLIGALIAGVVTTLLIAGLTANRRVPSDTAIGVIFTGAFALGVVLISEETIEGEELEHILFGDPLNATWNDVTLTLAIGAAVVASVIVLRRLFVAGSFDPSGARAMGLHTVMLDMLLLGFTALTVVIAFKAVGNILVIALLVTPAATARLFVDRLLHMMAGSVAAACMASVVGLYIGHHGDVSPGGAIVLVSTAGFALAWLFAPRHGVLSQSFPWERARLRSEPAEAVAEVIIESRRIQEPHAG